MSIKIHKSIILAGAVAVASTVSAQQPVVVSGGSYAAYPPTYKSKTDEHSGYQSTMMESKKLYVDETVKLPNGDRRPIPTNDWWTNLLNSRFADALWSYPQMLHPHEQGVTINYPTTWSDNGTEVLPTSSITIGGNKFTAKQAIAKDWHDWDVEMLLEGIDAKQQMLVTMAHGIPFSWFELESIKPVISFSATPTFYDMNGTEVATSDLANYDSNSIALSIGTDCYGLFLPKDAKLSWRNDELHIEYAYSTGNFISVGLLPAIENLSDYSIYAYSVPRNTTVAWNYNESKSTMTTSWTIDAENLLDNSLSAPIMQGFLPHAYKTTVQDFTFSDYRYLTPRGTMKIACSEQSNTFSYSYKFSGMLPFYAAPQENNADKNPFSLSRMTSLMNQYAHEGTFGTDTYWGGKGLTQMALNMTFAHELGNEELFAVSRDKLKAALEDWLTYTPGEDNFFFAYYPRWGGLVGYDVSYDSDAFNDHHFHYGYFVYAGALLCMFDKEFKAEYGEMLRTLARDYANWDRNDSRFPFLRTLDIWAGHSYAGGLGDGANSNGNGQESTSESMQSWGGLYLLGVALGDKEMRDAGIFGWLTESNGVAEYWFDRDQIYPDREHNIDHTKYQSPYCTNLTSKGIGWWTWFSGDPLWMHSIQWMPVSPCLNYLSQDLNFVKWDYEKMLGATAYKWFEKVGSNNPLANQSVGNVVLCYLERYNPDYAAEIFDQAWDGNYPLAKATDTGHISYYVIQSHRTYGDIDFTVSADCPTANAYIKADGTTTYMAYNPDDSQRTVRFYHDGAVVATVNVPAHDLVAYSKAATETSISLKSEKGFIIPQSASTQLTATVLDQYGASIDGDKVSFSVSDDAVASITTSGVLTIAQSAATGAKFSVTATTGKGTMATAEFTVNEYPRISELKILPLTQYLEIGGSIDLALSATDQYNNVVSDQPVWSITLNGKEVSKKAKFTPSEIGLYTIKATLGDKECSHTLFVTPRLQNISANKPAVASSEENAGTLSQSVNDGDMDTRWGSAHTDDEWVYIDLGADCRITRVEIDWEASFANAYDIQVAPDGAATTEHTGNYASGSKTISVVAEDQWTTAKEVRNFTAGGKASVSIDASGRYVRMKGVKRNSTYGYSIYEMAVYGIPAGASAEDIIGIDIVSPDIIDEGKTITLAANAYTLDGDIKPQNVTWSCDNDKCTFTGNDFLPNTYGKITVNATTAEGFTSSKTLLVSESIKLDSIDVSPLKSVLILGDNLQLTLTGYNQFGGDFPIDESSVKSIITEVSDSENPKIIEDGSATFDIATGIFSASVAGNYQLTLSGNFGSTVATITVTDVANANLALNQAASASSYQGGNTPSGINDGDTSTRWESATDDNQWLTIDLASPFVINRINLTWEAAYAKSYSIETSMDSENWTTAYTQGASNGGTEAITFAPVPAQYVRLKCNTRATTFGFSVYEMEVYGIARFSKSAETQAPEITSFTVATVDDKANVAVAATDESGYVFYTIDCYTTGAISNLVTSATGYAESGKPHALTVGNLSDNVEYEFRLKANDAFNNATFATAKGTIHSSIEGKNLAFGKATTTTSQENDGLGGRYAVDGDANTRWGSQFNNNEAITIDLGRAYLINDIVIDWNSPAFASEYIVETSLDDVTYKSVYQVADFAGGKDNIAITPTAARYVRVTGLKRATAYGTSINEIEVYGLKQLLSITSEVAGDKRLEGAWNDDVFALLDDIDATSYDMTAVASLPEKFAVKNPNCLIYLPTDYQHSLESNMVICNESGFNAANIDIQDGYNFSAIHDIEVDGDMTFHASMTDEHECLILPFPIAGNSSMRVCRPMGIKNGCALFSPLFTNKEEANRPVLLKLSSPINAIKGAGNTLYRTVPQTMNGATGVYSASVANGRQYRMNNGAFVLAIEGESINPFEVILTPADYSASGYGILVDGITGVDSINIDKSESALIDVYNLQGIRLRHNVQLGKALDGLMPGFYIVNGIVVCK